MSLLLIEIGPLDHCSLGNVDTFCDLTERKARCAGLGGQTKSTLERLVSDMLALSRMIVCSRCGKEAEEGVSFCSNCGNPILHTSSMQQLEYEVKYRPSYSMLVVHLKPNEAVTAEAGAMTYMSPSIQVQTRMREKSILGTIGLTVLGRQSFFVNDYRAAGGPGEVALVAAPIGDIDVLEVTPTKGYVIQKSAYIASTSSVNLDVQWEGFTKGLFGQGLFMIRVTGQGQLFINTFGALDRHTLEAGERLTVDNFHLVAFSDTCSYKVTKFGGLKETVLGGEGLVTEISGPGDVLIQTKNLKEFVDWIWTLMEDRIRARAR